MSSRSFVSNGTNETPFKLDQVSRQSSIISNKSGGSKSSKFRQQRLKKEGRMNLIEQKNAFTSRRNTTNKETHNGMGPLIGSPSSNHHLNLGVNMMASDPAQERINQK
jgi:hypothetical protein